MQPELNFNAQGSGGYELWVRQRQSMTAHLTDQLGFPIGREVELWLEGGIRLRGKLIVREDSIHWSGENRAVRVELGIGQVYFPISQIESCVRLD